MSSELQSIAATLQFTDYVALVIATAVTYDYILTFPNEIRYIWNRQWSSVSFLFLIVRYVGLAVVLIEGLFGSTFIPGPTLTDSRNKGTVLLLASDLGFVVFLAAADIVMILRVYAMYNKSRIVLGVLLVFCAATIIVYAISAVYYNNPHTYLTITTPEVLNMSFCNPTYTYPTSSKLGRYKMVPRLGLAALLFILVVARLCMESFQMYKATGQWKPNVYLNILVREGVLYFLVHLLNNINFGDGTVEIWVTTFIFILVFILSPRFIMNVRELYSRRLLYGSNCDKGIDTGFGIWDNQSSGTLAVSSVGFESTPGVAEGVEMQRIGSYVGSDHGR